MEDNIRKPIQKKTGAHPHSAAKLPIDMLADPSIPLKDKISAATVPAVSSYALLTDVFGYLAESTAIEVFRRSIINRGNSLDYPAIFRKSGISQSQASILSFSEFMLMIRDVFESQKERFKYSSRALIAATSVVALRFYYSEEDILAGNRPIHCEDSRVSFALRQFLYADPQSYLMWLRQNTNDPKRRSDIDSVLAYVRDYPQECVDQSLMDSDKTLVMAVGAILLNCYEMLESAPITQSERKKLVNIVYTLLVSPFAAYAESRGKTPEKIRRSMIEFSEYER